MAEFRVKISFEEEFFVEASDREAARELVDDMVWADEDGAFSPGVTSIDDLALGHYEVEPHEYPQYARHEDRFGKVYNWEDVREKV